jgi:hypothetical protein
MPAHALALLSALENVNPKPLTLAAPENVDPELSKP